MDPFFLSAESLIRPSPGAGPLRFSSVIVSEEPVIRLGLDFSGNYALLIEIGVDTESKHPLQLEHLLVQYGIECTVTDVSGIKSTIRVALVRLQNATASLRHYFLEVAQILTRALAGSTNIQRIEEAVSTLVELFRKLSQPSKRSVQGLWGELLVIDQAEHPDKLISAWRAEPQQRYDFSDGRDRIEAKTSASRIRIHRFSLEQLNPPPDSRLLIASLFCERASQGITVRDLLHKIVERVNDVTLLIKLETVIADSLASNLEGSLRVGFDYQLAKASLRFYSVRDVPTLAEIPPVGVTNISFDSNLESARCLTSNELVDFGGIYQEFG